MKKILSLAVACIIICTQGSTLALAAGGNSLTTKNTKSTGNTGVNAVETDIIRMQKDLVGLTRNMLEIVSKEGLKETGNMEFGIKTGSKELMNEFNLKVSNYQSTTNFLKSTAEVRGDIELSVFSSGSKIDYTKKLTTASGSTGNEESYEDYLSANYEKVPVQLNAKLKMNVQLAMDRKFLYFTLSAPEKTVTGTDKEVEEFENMIDAVNEYSGKTYKIATENSMDLTFASGKSKIQAVLNVLEKESLLEPKKRGADGSYQLDLKKSTLQSMNVALGRKKNADISGLKSLGGTLVYKKSGGLTTLKLTPAYAKTKALKDKNFMLLENTGSDYIFSGKTYEKVNSKYNKKTTIADFRVARNAVTMNVSEKTDWSNTTTKLNWNGNDFSLKITESGSYSAKNTTTIDGTLNFESKIVNLTVKNGGNQVATIQASPENTGYKYGVIVNFNFFGQTFDFFAKGFEVREYGNFEVTIPKNAELIDEEKLKDMNF